LRKSCKKFKQADEVLQVTDFRQLKVLRFAQSFTICDLRFPPNKLYVSRMKFYVLRRPQFYVFSTKSFKFPQVTDFMPIHVPFFRWRSSFRRRKFRFRRTVSAVNPVDFTLSAKFRPLCATLGQNVPVWAKMCRFVLFCAVLCSFVPKCATLCRNVPLCALLCRNVPSWAKLGQNVPLCAVLCQNVLLCAVLGHLVGASIFLAITNHGLVRRVHHSEFCKIYRIPQRKLFVKT
jgi:hypothetical protein